MPLISRYSTKRGDTLIEVMFAIGFFALIAIISVAIMNSGINDAERDLELVTARNELNAQAEALRFIHSSYISEKTLPDGDQKYKQLWETIVGSAVNPDDAKDSGLLDLATIGSCSRVYDQSGGKNLLQEVNAFVINTRKVTPGNNVDYSFIGINRPASASTKFVETELSARILYRQDSAGATGNSDDQLVDSTGDNKIYFDRVTRVEGIWDFVVKGEKNNPQYYDFYIQTCWYGPRAKAPTVLDTVIRLYNPENIK